MLETMDSHDACTCSMCSCHVFRSVFKLNIVCVLSANALECISLEIFLRNGLAPGRVSLLMPFYSCPTSSVSFLCNYDLLDLNLLKKICYINIKRKRSYGIIFVLPHYFFHFRTFLIYWSNIIDDQCVTKN